MGTLASVSLDESFRTSYRPDAEYVDGRIEERSTGKIEHSATQRQLLLLLSQDHCLTHFICYPELRVQTSERHCRIPDLCVLALTAPWESVVQSPPMLCIEVLSDDDTMKKTPIRVREFLAMGVPEVWVFDPESRSVEVCRGTSVAPQIGDLLTVPETQVTLSVEKVFSVLDR